MTLTYKQLHPSFVGEPSPIDLRSANAGDLAEVRRGMDHYGVLVFRGQAFSDDEQLAFAERFDGTLHAKTSTAVLEKNRFGNEALSDISNVGKDGQLLAADDRRRMSSLANRLWHTDASFVDPAGRYSMLSARVIPPVHANTEFADMRGAYDALDDEMKAVVDELSVHHSIAYSREVLGFEFAPGEKEMLKGAVHPLVRRFPETGRRSLYLASHAQSIVGWPVPEARLLLRDLMEHATQPRFVYSHQWRLGDFVIWDNRATMHRATPFDDKKYRRELRRTTTLDIARPAAAH
ncbi:MAG: taurine catabolism dioxygenase tauD/tfdA [Ramlibacter sp.]|jgi:alpha-ketoglutarate-dependent 2,4-dichlorophenoxyacetate dioxygenase|nr:taurine catabolism dioxygenase tauD/tfdA [Ramlibacter sp.]